MNEFVLGIKNIYGDKYINRIIKRLNELEEIKYEFNDSKYIASSKKNYIVFFKNIKDEKNFKYVLEHELFHFIQKENSEFENIPEKYKNILSKDIKIELLEEVFVQYFTAKINNKKPEYQTKIKDGKLVKYWLNECYKDIVWIGEELEQRIGELRMFEMYMDDEIYKREINNFDRKYGENEFAKYIEKIENIHKTKNP